ncbi:MAG: hypothetical protein GYB58_14535 [Gammaproteobacteria bacterium]|nr:hypothetical protein [Gammaproteobacteria bacterium]
MSMYFLFVTAAMAIFFLFIGIKVIVSNKPLLIPSKIFIVLVLFTLLPKAIFILEYHLSSPVDLGVIAYISPLITIVLLVFCWIQLKGYIAIGISDDSFRDSLHYALRKNSIEFEEQLSLIKLKDVKADLQVSVQSWMGTGQFKLKNSKNSHLLAKLIPGINDFFLANEIKPNNTVSVFYVVLGLLMLILAGSFYFSMQR